MKDSVLFVLIGVLFVLAASPLVYGYVYTSVMHGGSWNYGGMMASDGDHCGASDSEHEEHMEECEYMASDHVDECESMMAEYGGSEHVEECEGMMGYSMMGMHMEEYSNNYNSNYSESYGMGCH